MKYYKQNCINENLNMDIGGEFIGRENHINVKDNLQHNNPRKLKRFRSAFTTDQVNYLEKQFKKFPYIGNAQRKEIAAALNIAERAVKIWFQNRRMKEKKESITKEVYDEQDIRNSLELTKDQLNNVTAPSANGQPRSLPILTHLSEGKCYNNIKTINSTSARQSAESKDSAEKPVACSEGIPNVVTTAKVIHPPSVFVKTSAPSPEVKTSAEFSIELCKKHKSELSTNAEVHTFGKEVDSRKKLEEIKSMGFTDQITPKDSSLSRKMNRTATDPQQTGVGNASSNPGFVSLVPTVSPFYTQPYISASGVIWKPMSVLPVVTSSSSPVSALSNSLSNMRPVQANFSKKPCNCDCHVSKVTPQISYNFTQQSPQYIITAMPVQNTSTRLTRVCL